MAKDALHGVMVEFGGLKTKQLHRNLGGGSVEVALLSVDEKQISAEGSQITIWTGQHTACITARPRNGTDEYGERAETEITTLTSSTDPTDDFQNYKGKARIRVFAKDFAPPVVLPSVLVQDSSASGGGVTSSEGEKNWCLCMCGCLLSYLI